MKLYDCHTHSDASHDGHDPVEALCRAAEAAGLCGFAVTDHSDTADLDEEGWARLRRSAEEAERARDRWAGRLEVLVGVEIGEECFAPEAAARVRALADYDVILSSLHGLLRGGAPAYYSAEPFDRYTPAEAEAYLGRYLDVLAENAAQGDYDVLTHLDCPVRYMNGRYGLHADALAFPDKVDAVLKTVIRRDKTLELNTSGLGTPFGQTLPREAVLRRYYELGGRRVVLGSDAHTAARIGAGLPEGEALLRRIGFAGLTVYRRRSPVFLPFD